MAPIQSKLKKKKVPEGPAALVELVTAAVWEQFDNTLEDLADLAVFVADCCDSVGKEIGKAGQNAAEALGDAFASTAKSLRCCADASCWSGESSSVPLTSTAPIIFVMQVIAILYSSFVFCYMPAAGIAIDSPISLLFHGFVFMTLASFMQVYFTDPGTPPDSEEWHTFGKPPSCLRERKASAKGSARWCRKSEMYKPDRAHFCKVKDSVVLRMDHHCPWLGNTIGYANHKYFFLVLLYSCATCTFVDVNFILSLLQATLPPTSLLVLMESTGLSLLLSSILLPFFVFHCWLIANNMTTIEFCERRGRVKQTEEEKHHQDDNDENLYDIGVFANCQAVLGHNPLTWLLPIGGPSGDGMSFPTSDVSFEEDSKVAGETSGWLCGGLADAAGDILAGCNLLADVSQDAVSMIAGIFCGSTTTTARTPSVRRPSTSKMQRSESRQVRTEKRVQVHRMGAGPVDAEFKSGVDKTFLGEAGPVDVDLKGDVVTSFLEEVGEVDPKRGRVSVASVSTTATTSRLSQFSVASTTASTTSFSESDPL